MPACGVQCRRRLRLRHAWKPRGVASLLAGLPVRAGWLSRWRSVTSGNENRSHSMRWVLRRSITPAAAPPQRRPCPFLAFGLTGQEENRRAPCGGPRRALRGRLLQLPGNLFPDRADARRATCERRHASLDRRALPHQKTLSRRLACCNPTVGGARLPAEGGCGPARGGRERHTRRALKVSGRSKR